MASFNGATFYERPADGTGYATWNAAMLLAIKPRPNEDPVIQEIGADVQRLALAVEVTGAELASLYDQVLESGTLIMDWETASAFLESIDAPQQIGIGNDLFLTALNLIYLESIALSTSILDESGGALLMESGDMIILE